jgi:hypothetical protein
MPIANGRTPPQCRDEANFVRLGHCGAGHPELLSARFPPRSFEPCDALGRSQVVRQRILIPPSGGSNPPAPATHSANVQTSRHGAESPAFCGPLRARRLETDGTCRAIAILRARSLMPIFQSPEFARTPAETGLRSGCDGTAVTAAEGRRDSRALGVLLPCSDCAGLGQTMPSCSSCLAQDSGRFRASQVTVRSAGARPSAMA